MKTLRLTIVALFLAVSFGAHSASALSEDDSSAVSKNGAANLGDPDDAIQYPHVSDDGTPSSNNFQAQPTGNNSSVSFGVTPSSGAPADSAFERAQERMQQ